MARRNTACQTCRSIKARCTNELPCARCRRLQLPCHYGAGGSASAPARDRAGRGRVKAEHSKTATGCLSCRRRRRKCDEKLPICSDCERLQLPCMRPSPHSDSSPSQESPDTVVEAVAETLPEFNWPALDSSESHSSPTRLSSIQDWLALIQNDNLATATKTARLANSTALIHVDPPCAEDDDIGLAIFLPSTALNNLTGVTPQTLISWDIGERHLLNHFLQYVSRSLAVVEDRANPWLRVIVPMALENRTVKHSVIALSACHIAKAYPDFEYDVCLHRNRALQGLLAELGAYESSLYAVAATLILSLAEICTGNSRKWVLHLHGARALLAKTHRSRLKPPFHTLVEMFNYIACITSITSEQAPDRLGSKLQVLNTSSKMEIHPLFGTSAELFDSISQITLLASQKGESSADQMRRKAEEIELSLQSWEPLDMDDQPRSFIEARAVGFALQSAASIRLLQVSKQLKNDDPQITKMASNILSALSLIRPGSEMEAHMLFPLFMAGVGSTHKPNRLTVVYRLDVMETTVGFGNISTAHKLLDDIWKRSHQGEIADWEELMRSDYPGLVLF